jgi:hypothetical protein
MAMAGDSTGFGRFGNGLPPRGGLLGAFLGPRQPQGLLGYNPAAMRRSALSRGLLMAGAELLGQGPSPVPIGFGQSIGAGLKGFAQGADEGRQQYQQDWENNYKLSDLAEDQKRKTERDAELKKLLDDPKVPQNMKAWIKINPDKALEEWYATENEPAEAPKTREFRRGSQQVTQQWNPTTRQWDEVATGQAFSDKPLVSIGGDNSADAKLRTELAANEGKRWSEIEAAGATSGAMIQDLEIMDELAKMAPQGPVAGRLAETFPGFSAAGDAFESVAKRVAPSLRTPGSGSTSDVEYEGFVKSMPRLRNTEGGNQIVSEVLKQKAQINVERAAIVTAYQNEQISASQARSKLAELNKRSILTPQMKSLISSATGADLIEKYGLEK